MALEPGSALRSSSPVSSRSSSPVNPKPRAGADDETFKNDKSYRRYASGVGRALSLFDTALQEWADYISFLGRLLKALHARPPAVNIIPHKAMVAKRLAQCLSPTLPSGVHQKALEVYSHIFSTIGTDALSRDLTLYLPGLSSTLSFASLSVKPAFLSLVETYLVTLDPSALRPALKAIILCLLPGLEEESSEDFERTLRLLNEFRRVVRVGKDMEDVTGDQYFWQCLFLASITSPSKRPGALAYLIQFLPKLANSTSPRAITNGHRSLGPEGNQLSPAIENVLSPEPGLLIRCFAAGLGDDQLLIQRGFLDLLVTNLPLHSAVLQDRVTAEDLERLVVAAVGVVARRDMSLNRRLWTWLLGPDRPPSEEDSTPSSPSSPSSEISAKPSDKSVHHQTRYFSQYGLRPLVDSVRSMIDKKSSTPAERVRPFRICLSLMDRWEVGGLVIPNVFLPMVESLRQFETHAESREAFNEVLKSGKIFFDGVESGLIWGEILGQLTAALGESNIGTKDGGQSLALVKFMVTQFNLRDEEMLVVHIPTVTLALLSMLEITTAGESGHSKASHTENARVIASALGIAQQLIDMIPERVFVTNEMTQSSVPPSRHDHSLQSREIIDNITKFYDEVHGNIESSDPPFSTYDIGGLLLNGIVLLLTRGFQRSFHVSTLEACVSLLNSLLRKVPYSGKLYNDQLVSAFQQSLKPSPVLSQTGLPFPALSAIVSCLYSLYQASSPNYCFSDEQASYLTPVLVRQLWSYLAPSNPKYHVEAVRCIRRLHTITKRDRLVEASITTLMVDESNDENNGLNSEASRSFAILWAHCVQLSDGVPNDTMIQNLKKVHESKARGSMEDDDDWLTRPVFLLLDALSDEGSEMFIFVRAWLQNLPSVTKILYAIISKLQALPSVSLITSNKGPGDREEHIIPDNIDECRYFLQTTRNVLQCVSSDIWLSLANQVVRTGEENDESSSTDLGEIGGELSLQIAFVKLCLQVLSGSSTQIEPKLSSRLSGLYSTALLLLRQFLLGPAAAALMLLEVENILITELLANLDQYDTYVQVALLDTLYAALTLRILRAQPSISGGHQRTPSLDTVKSASRLSLSTERSEREQAVPSPPSLPPQLVECITKGLSSPGSRPNLDSWIRFVEDCLPLYADSLFQVLIPLVECFCINIRRVFENLQLTFRLSSTGPSSDPEPVLILLLNGLEQMLARAHERLITEEVKNVAVKSPEQPQGFFGNMVSGVFASETSRSRNELANRRLTVLLCFKDTVSICYDIWSWGGHGSDGTNQDPASLASFNYTSIRLRNRARRILEHLFTAEGLECLETLIDTWRKSKSASVGLSSASVFHLLHALDGSRPKNTIPAVFNAIYSRTNPIALEPMRKSTLTSNLSDTELVTFLVEYARSLEDDAMDEIWIDCMTFLRDVLANPFPNRQILPRLLEFTALLGQKVDNTIFGEQRRMRRELGDVFARLLTATFTTRPLGFSQDAPQPAHLEKLSLDGDGSVQNTESKRQGSADDILTILEVIVPNLPKILPDTDRIVGTATTISTNVISPLFRSRSFPSNVSQGTLNLLYGLSRLPSASKSWKKDISDGFNDTKFFSTSLELVEKGWIPLLRQWVLSDKDRIPELLSRLTSPTTAGIMFGVGASSARLETDRKTQLTLRRVALLILAAAEDAFVTNLAGLEEKLVDLMSATAASSPSSTTRAEVYMVFRALVLRTSAVHLASLWPVLNAELQSSISSVVPGGQPDIYNNHSILQACKLLDVLLTIAPDEFQLHEWLFITDTIDAVYRPSNWTPVALADRLSEHMRSTASIPTSHITAPASSAGDLHSRRRPLLDQIDTKVLSKEDLVGMVLKPFFSQLSIYAFESTYGMGEPDRGACVRGLLEDICDESTMVG